MPVPAQSLTHVTDSLALLISRYGKQPVVTGIVKSLSTETQALENAAWAVINALILSTAPMAGGPWDIYDKLAALVGVPGGRLGRSDADLVQAIKIQIRINISHGLAEDIIQIVALVQPTGATYSESYPASFEVDLVLTKTAVVNALLRYLDKARSAGTRGFLNYALGPTAALILDSTTGHPASVGLLDDSVSDGFHYNLSSYQVI